MYVDVNTYSLRQKTLVDINQKNIEDPVKITINSEDLEHLNDSFIFLAVEN